MNYETGIIFKKFNFWIKRSCRVVYRSQNLVKINLGFKGTEPSGKYIIHGFNTGGPGHCLTSWKFPASLCYTRTFCVWEAERELCTSRALAPRNVSQVHVTLYARLRTSHCSPKTLVETRPSLPIVHYRVTSKCISIWSHPTIYSVSL